MNYPLIGLCPQIDYMNPMQNIPVPERLKARPMFRGVPIPFSSFVRDDGTPDFKVTDQHKWNACVTRRLCAICGGPLDGSVFFIGGERCMETHIFFDPAMHEECARYSFAVCPFIACGKEYAAKLPTVPEGHALHVHTAVSAERPKRMGMLICYSFRAIRIPSHEGIYIQALEVIAEEYEK